MEGRFQEALGLAERALEIAPENALFHYVEEESLLALGRFDLLIERAEAAREQDLQNGDIATQLVLLHVAAGDEARARAVADDYVSQFKESEVEVATQWRHYLDATYHLGSGDASAFAQNIVAIEGARYQYQDAMVRGDYRSGMEALAAAGEQTAVDHLLVSLAATRADDRETAETELEAAIDELSKSTTEDRLLARCLNGELPSSRASRLDVEPATKSVALAVLSTRTGDVQLRRLARALNYQLSFERYWLQRLGL